MSTRTVTRAPSRATYAELTHVAGRRLARALVALESRGPQEPRSNGSAAAYRDLADALAHLGSRLVTPIPRVPASGRSTRVRRGPDTHLLASLREVAQARDWDHPHPVEGIAADLDRAAVLLRAAADLWATHHTPDGHPRSIEGSRMRHPATLGAALREWRWMVTLSAAFAGALADHGSVPNLPADPDDHRDLASSPLPAGGMAPAGSARAGTARASTARAGTPPGLLHLTVARPGLLRGQPPLIELAQRIDRLRHLAWKLAETGSAPATVHGNMAAIAVAVHQAAAETHRSMARGMPVGPQRRQHVRAEARAREGLSRWQAVVEDVRSLRSAHPATHPIQVERLDIHRLLGRLTPRTGAATSTETCVELNRLADSFADIAHSNAQAVRAAHDRGDLLLIGRAIPQEALPRRPDLLRARLSDEVIPAPELTIDRLEATYRDIARGAPHRTSPDVSPPAA